MHILCIAANICSQTKNVEHCKHWPYLPTTCRVNPPSKGLEDGDRLVEVCCVQFKREKLLSDSRVLGVLKYSISRRF